MSTTSAKPAPTHEHRFWITPPELRATLDSEFHFTHEICKFPPENNDLFVDWGPKGSTVHGNPPFRAKDGSPTAFVGKAIEQAKDGRTIVLTLPVQSYVNLALEAGAEIRPLGRVRWLCVDCGKPMSGPSPIIALIFRPEASAPPAAERTTLKAIQGKIEDMLQAISMPKGSSTEDTLRWVLSLFDAQERAGAKA